MRWKFILGAVLVSAALFVLTMVATGAHQPVYDEKLEVRFGAHDGPYMDLEKGSRIRCGVDSDQPIDIYVMRRADTRSLDTTGVPYDAVVLFSAENATGADIDVETPSSGEWAVVFVNIHKTSPAEVHYRLETESDGRTAWCAMSGVILLVPGAYLIAREFLGSARAPDADGKSPRTGRDAKQPKGGGSKKVK